MKYTNEFKVHAYDGSFFWLSRKNTVYEIDSIDIFKKVKNDLNIAISQKHDSFNK